jgi:DNA-binding Xre family transcriptional regulator
MCVILLCKFEGNLKTMIKMKLQETARKNGLTTAYTLQKALNCSPTMASRLWNEKFKQIGIETIGSLCDLFNCQPNDLFENQKAQTSNTQFDNSQTSNTQTSNTQSSVSVPSASKPQSVQPEAEKPASKPGMPNKPVFSRDLMTTGDVMKYFDRPETTIRRWRDKHELKARKENGTWQFARDDVEAFEKSDFYINEAKK